MPSLYEDTEVSNLQGQLHQTGKRFDTLQEMNKEKATGA